MSSKAVMGKSHKSKGGLAHGEPSRRRRNTSVDDTRHASMAAMRKTAGGLGSDADKEKPKKRRAGLSAQAADDGSEIGRRVGRTVGNVKRAQARPEKTRRDRPVDTSKPGVAADDRKVGDGHTARRNTKLNTRKATAALEDSANGKPSRKSTRRSTNRIKAATQLTRRTKRAVNSPKAPAARA
jgi:hypothetical protein